MATLADALKEKLHNFHEMIVKITPPDKQDRIDEFSTFTAEQMVLFVNREVSPHYSRGDLDTPASKLFELLALEKNTFPAQYQKTKRYVEYFAKQVEYVNQN